MHKLLWKWPLNNLWPELDEQLNDAKNENLTNKWKNGEFESYRFWNIAKRIFKTMPTKGTLFLWSLFWNAETSKLWIW